MFQKLKERFTKELVLVASDLNKKIRMEVDYVMGEVLSMEYKDRKQRYV